MTKLLELSPNPKNPRRITKEKLQALRAAIEEYGNLDGVIYNRRSRQLAGGHQRRLMDDDAVVTIERRFDTPTRVGTVAEGHVLINGERFNYREVDWPEAKELGANIAANKGAGDWDYGLLQEMFETMDAMGADLSLTMFDDAERKRLMDDLNKNLDAPPPDDDGGAGNYTEQYGVIVTCHTAGEQEETYNALKENGYNCKVVVT
jgi:hypothetical protein